MQAAGNAVKRATEALVRAAKKLKGGEWDDEDFDVAINQRMVGGIAQVCQEDNILRGNLKKRPKCPLGQKMKMPLKDTRYR